MADKGEPSLADVLKEVASLRGQLTDMNRQITAMQRMGGFSDSKTVGVRCTRIEARVEALEIDGEMLKDVAGLHVTLLEDHLKDRHDADLDRDNAIDTISFRKIRRRMRLWAEKRGLIERRDDLGGARRDENRLRPAAASS